MLCKICQKEFNPSKYRPSQQVCSASDCQKARQLQNLKQWRLKNPDYFRYLDQDTSWKLSRKRYTQLWKGAHKEDLKEYESVHRPQRKEYMREYMRNYRETHPGAVLKLKQNRSRLD